MIYSMVLFSASLAGTMLDPILSLPAFLIGVKIRRYPIAVIGAVAWALLIQLAFVIFIYPSLHKSFSMDRLVLTFLSTTIVASTGFGVRYLFSRVRRV